jgi:DNA mismatch repair protein MutS
MTRTPQIQTPLMQQYHDLKLKYHDALLLFQVGDFYELFYDDARIAATHLGIALTTRGKDNGEPIPLCGVPVHTKDHYIAKLVKGGFRVALCNQLESAIPGVVVKRGVTQVYTPATLVDTHMLDERTASYLCSCFPHEKGFGLVFGELLTAQLFATTISEYAEKSVDSELIRFFPDEILLPNTSLGKSYITQLRKQGYEAVLVDMPDEAQQAAVQAWLRTCCNVTTMQEVSTHEQLRSALHYFYAYLSKNNRMALEQFQQLTLYTSDQFLMLDAVTQRNLELVRNNHDGSSKQTLVSVIDRTQSPMGARLLKKWVVRPLASYEAIMQRQAVVAHWIMEFSQADRVHQYISHCGDLERIVGRIALCRGHVHDYIYLKKGLQLAPCIGTMLIGTKHILLQTIANQCTGFDELVAVLEAALYEDAHQNWCIKPGYDATLDAYRLTVAQATERLLALEISERELTGISSLKVGYNHVHGYYIEVTNTHRTRVPERYIRRQTLAGKERYVTSALQTLEYEIQQARIQIEEYEKTVYENIKKIVARDITKLRRFAHALANLDVFLSLAVVARDNRYVQPSISATEQDLLIADGRHPVVEALMQERFIPNDLTLTNTLSTIIITGPNMGGKSTYLRQAALIAILGQMGSFVPASMATLPLLDRIFTRIGAGDNVVEGKSTFLMEMEETALICRYATERSLVILDEVGRGTSTYDGLAIAQAVIEHIHTVLKARCLFATHYHELVRLENSMPGLVSYHAASTKTTSGIIFLYKMVRGAADGSFGIEVARMAQLPATVLVRARELLADWHVSSESSITPVVPVVIPTRNKVLQKI